MTPAQPGTEAGTHPFVAAVASQDLDALVATLAPDAALHSAVVGAPFEGREVLADIYASLFESLEELRVMDEFRNDDTTVFFWEGRIEGRFVAGADRVRVNQDGSVREITIVGRPLSGLAGFVSGIGYHFARRRRGPVVARILRLAALPLGPLFASLDVVTRWLARGNRR
jgi:hypothetical protein